MAHKTSNDVIQVFDITTFLWHARCFAILIHPFVYLVKGGYDIVSWTYPKLTFVIWLLLNIFSSLIPPEYTLVLFIFALGISCILGLLHHYTHIFIKLFPDADLARAALETYLQRNWGDEQRILEEYRKVLLTIDNLLARCNSALQFVYDVLKWEQPFVSACWSAGILTASLLIYLGDLQFLIFIANNVILLGSGIQWHRNKKVVPSASEVPVVESNITEPLPTECKKEIEESDDPDGDEQDSSESTDTKPVEEFGPGKSRPNVVKKLIDLRKRHHQAVAGVCSGCQASFISILKRKYFCCNCGNQFCSRCCYLKVPKSFLGVTAPSTKNDTVLLCGPCHRHLLAK